MFRVLRNIGLISFGVCKVQKNIRKRILVVKSSPAWWSMPAVSICLYFILRGKKTGFLWFSVFDCILERHSLFHALSAWSDPATDLTSQPLHQPLCQDITHQSSVLFYWIIDQCHDVKMSMLALCGPPTGRNLEQVLRRILSSLLICPCMRSKACHVWDHSPWSRSTQTSILVH